MPVAFVRRLVPAIVLATLPIVGIDAHAARAAPKLTCSFINKQCVTECVKQAGRGFCQLFCNGERRNCLSTGRWSTFGRTFDNVVKR